VGVRPKKEKPQKKGPTPVGMGHRVGV